MNLDEKKNKPLSIKTIISIIAIIIMTIVVFTIFFNFNDINETIELLKHVDGLNMFYAFISLFIYALLWPLSLCLIGSDKKFNSHFLDNYLVAESEHFFNGITPFSTGGQPIQVYLFTKKNVTASNSTGIIVTNFIAFMIATNIFAVASLVYYEQFSENFNSSTAWMIALGFAMNFFTLIFMILMITCRFIRDFLKKCLESLCKLNFIGKHLSKTIPMFEKYCENAQIAAKEIFANKLNFIGAILLKMLALVFYYSIPFYLLNALGANLGYNLLPYIILASAFAITTMVWVPTPGGTGGIEFAFKTIFTASIFGITGSSIGVTGMILWRFLTYYLLMLISFVAYLIFEIRCKKEKKKEKEIEGVIE